MEAKTEFKARPSSQGPPAYVPCQLPPPVEIPPHILRLRWCDYLDRLDIDSFQSLLRLIEPPSMQSARKFKHGTLPWKIERTLVVIKKVAKVYILDADRQLSCAHSRVKDAVTHGYAMIIF
jgi:hypothetical protein